MAKAKSKKLAIDALPLRLEWRSPAELSANPRNWRKHPEAQQAALAGVLSEVGWAGACLLNETTGLLIDGHLRQKVALANGADKIPVLVGNWTPEQESKILATLDPLAGMAEADPVALDALLRDVNTGCEELQQMLADLWEDNKPPDEPPEVDEDTPPEPQACVVTRPGDLWTLGRHRLLCGDCRDAAAWDRLLGGETIGVIATDPPYGIDHPTNYAGRGRGNLAACRDYPKVIGDGEPFDPAWMLSLDKPALLWGGNWFASRLPDSGGWLVWDKERPDDLDQATCELAWTNFVKGVRRIKYLWNGMMKEGKETLVHPTQKPIAVIAWSLSLPWTPSGIVADPYVGSGTTIMACEHLNRRCVACEISPAYVDVCIRRYAAKYPGQPITRHDGVTWQQAEAECQP